MEDRNLSEVAQNPFAALFPSVEKAEKYRKQHGDAVTTLQTVDQHNADTVMQTQPLSVLLKDVQGIDSKNETEHGVVETLNNEKDRAWLVNDLLQRVFLITVDNGNVPVYYTVYISTFTPKVSYKARLISFMHHVQFCLFLYKLLFLIEIAACHLLELMCTGFTAYFIPLTIEFRECLLVTSWWPYWCPKTMKWQP